MKGKIRTSLLVVVIALCSCQVCSADGPSVWSQMTRSTTKFFRQTTDFLTPSFMKSKPMPRRSTGSRRVVTREPAKKSSSWFPWFSKKPEKPANVQSFIGQKRPY